MTPRTKKLIGTIVILVWIVVYVLVAGVIGVHIAPYANEIGRFVYYALAGTLWIIPIGLMFPWMYREPNATK